MTHKLGGFGVAAGLLWMMLGMAQVGVAEDGVATCSDCEEPECERFGDDEEDFDTCADISNRCACELDYMGTCLFADDITCYSDSDCPFATIGLARCIMPGYCREYASSTAPPGEVEILTINEGESNTDSILLQPETISSEGRDVFRLSSYFLERLGVNWNFSIDGRSNPSLCFSLRVTNTNATPVSVTFRPEIPITPLTTGFEVTATLEGRLIDNNGDGASLTVQAPSMGLLDGFVADAPQSTVFGLTELGSSRATPGEVALRLVGPEPGPAPPAAGWEVLSNFTSFTLSPHDTVVLHAATKLDNGTGAPVCPPPRSLSQLPMPVDPAPITSIPTLSQWGMILMTLSLLTLATWQLAGRPALAGARASEPEAVLPPRPRWVTSLLVGQGAATLGLLFYGALIGPLAPHDGVGALVSGLLWGAMVECFHRRRRP